MLPAEAPQQALKAVVSLARRVGEKLFPSAAAEIIDDVIARDLPYYTPEISEETEAGINRFSKASGLLTASQPYDEIVATQFRDLWTVN
jgi:NitT/TauT family transport system substrate-binding protein